MFAASFWVMHDAVFAHQSRLDEPALLERAAAAGVDSATLVAVALERHQLTPRVERDGASGRANGVAGTPSVFIDGVRSRGPRDVATVSRLLSTEPLGDIRR